MLSLSKLSEKLLPGIDYYLRSVPFPNRSSRAVVLPNTDGTFDIYINTLFSEAEQEEALQHELRHLIENHFYDERPVAINEAEANGKKKTALLAEEPKRFVSEYIRCFPSLDALLQFALENGGV